MVIGHDFSSLKQTDSIAESNTPLYETAPRLDRVAAALVDMTIVITLSRVFAARSIYALKVSANFGLDQSLFASGFNIIWLTFSVLLVYNVLTYRILGRTFGQILFSLTTVSANKFKLIDSYTLVLRSFLSFIGFFLFFPILSIFLNKDGRTFYDKICETIIVTSRVHRKSKNVILGFDKLMGSIIVLVLFVSLSYTSLYLSKNTFKFKSDFVKNSKICSHITDFHNHWTENKIQESRLEVALALYSAGELSVDCLSKEIDFEFNINPVSPSAYFAKGLLSFENDSSFMRYFKKTCEIDLESSACHVATWMSFWPNTYEGERPVSEYKDMPMFMRIWDIKRQHQKGNIATLKELIHEMPVPKGLEGFYAEHLMRVELFQGQSKAFENVLKLAENKNLRSRKLTELFCGTVVGDGCENLKIYDVCNRMDINRSTENHLQNMYYACHGTEKRIFSTNTLVEDYYRKLATKELLILDDLKNIFLDSNLSFPIRYATLNSFLKQVTNLEYLLKAKEDWEKTATKDFIWRLVGEGFKNKLKALGDTQSSFGVYKSLAREYHEMKINTDFFKNENKNEIDRVPAQENTIRRSANFKIKGSN